MRIHPTLALLLPTAIHGGAVATAGVKQAACTNLNVAFFGDGERSCAQDDQEYYASESSYEVEAPASLTRDEQIGADIGKPQLVDMQYSEAILHRIKSAREYIDEVVNVEDKYKPVRDLCANKHESCAFWAILGECEKNPGYMQVNCAPVCNSCEQLNIETRCPMDPNAVDALQPGDLNAMFERIVTDPAYQEFEPVVLSRPSYAPGDTPENATYKIGIWMIEFENALSEEEAERMIALGGELGYERSKDVGVKQADGSYTAETNSGRTSTNAVSCGIPT